MITEKTKGLLERIRSGTDNEAETELLARYGQRIERKVNYYIGYNNPDSSDIISESKIAVLLSLREGRFDPSKNIPLGSYIHGITKNKIKDYFKFKQTDRTTSIDVIEDSSLSSDISGELERKELRDIMRIYLSSLDIKFQEVLHLKFYEQLTITEISSRINLPPKRVSERIHYALKKMKKKCKKEKYLSIFLHFLLTIL
jgi:RNA polymerase sigma factor (sigma-70 family)